MPKLSDLKKFLEELALQAPSAEISLRVVKMLGTVLWNNHDGILSAENFEKVLLESLEGKLTNALKLPSEPSFQYLHIVTQTYGYGGHTLLLRQIAQAQQKAGHAPRILCLQDAPSLDFGSFGIPPGQVLVPKISLSNRHDLLTKARATLNIAAHARTIVLHIHPDDIGSALVARLLRRMGRRVLFLNHADHVFSYGPGAADAILEVSGWGWKVTAAQRAHRAQSYIGIAAVIDRENRATAAASVDLDGPIVSMGSPIKYQPAPGNDFPRFLTDLLRRVPNPAELIGPSGDEPWWSGLREAHPGRVTFHGLLPFEKAKTVLARASCYLDSFPQGGGTAFTQAFMAGKKVFASNRRFAGGYSIAEAFRSDTIEEMIEEIVAFLSGMPIERRVDEDDLRERIAREFSAAAVADRVEAAARGDYVLPPDEIFSCARPLDYYSKVSRGRSIFLHPLRLLSLDPVNQQKLQDILQALGDRKL